MVALRKLSENFVATKVDDEILIVDLDGGELFSLKGTARSVWDAIDGKCSEAEIAAQMAEQHEGDKQAIARDVAELIGQLQAASLVAHSGQ